MLGLELSEQKEGDLLKFLLENKEVFAWTPKETLGIDPVVIVLNVDPANQEVEPDPLVEEFERLVEGGAIKEVQYPTWLTNTVIVKNDEKWSMCVDFTDLNKACPKDSFSLPKIDQLIDAMVRHECMSFLDAYRGYHQITMFGPDQSKTSFTTPKGLFYYKVMSFGLKNAGMTYQRLVMRMF